jgi:3-hydroxymyristoyl/3-hydroxydecanoyl-(acyl carrier protein) dehydratase
LTSDTAATSILNQALHGFDFTATVQRAHQDGVRIFLEMGPYSSCTRMIGHILQEKDHLALAACVRGEDDYTTITKVLAALIAERVPVDLDKLYGPKSFPPQEHAPLAEVGRKSINVLVGGNQLTHPHLHMEVGRQTLNVRGQQTEDHQQSIADTLLAINGEEQPSFPAPRKSKNSNQHPSNGNQYSDVIEAASQVAKRTADAHQKFLELSSEFSRSYAEILNFQTRLLKETVEGLEKSCAPFEIELPDADIPPDQSPLPESSIAPSLRDVAPSGLKSESSTSAVRRPTSKPAFSREACLEFARGSVTKVLGPEFSLVDTYDARVRLPDEPLMLVDRIIAIEGERGSLGSGRIVTEHEVLPGSWYLDGGHAPVCISVEAGQADLFLCAYLGIDLAVQGKRTYRLLDATVKFHRSLPVPGETIRYEIEIEKFIRQGDTYLFLFHFDGYVEGTPLITMSDGCAGFFTEEEVKNSGGIVLIEENIQPVPEKKPSNWKKLVPLYQESYDDPAVQALRKGNLAACFGSIFKETSLAQGLRLPGGRMKLIDRVINLDPFGGRFGLGLVQAEANINPDDWFLTCHFVDDMVMPGTLMYECCAHTLRVFMQRLGWVTDRSGVYYEPVIGVKSSLKCRGPVTPETQKVTYEIEIKQIGYKPEPFAIADAYMYADGHRIVYFRDMSMQMTGITRVEIEGLWQTKKSRLVSGFKKSPKSAIFDRRHMLEFAEGSPSKAFGDRYKSFDEGRFIARLPRPPYLLIDRIITAEPEPWILKPDGWIEAEVDIDPNAWFFRSDRTPAAPISILLEIALQPCGWLAAYMGSALKSRCDLRFRNLGGRAELSGEVPSDAGTLTTKARLTNASEAADMIIEHFEFEVYQQKRKIYTGSTYFGFFTQEALAQQEGIREAVRQAYTPPCHETQNSFTHHFVDTAPLYPGDPNLDAAAPLAIPAKAIRMIDQIEAYIPDGGPLGLGYIRGTKKVDPQEWFFNAHFYQDPVCPGSLGIESFIQLLKYMALARWPQFEKDHRFGLWAGSGHSWVYRGQILPENRLIAVEAVITKIQEQPLPGILADGFLKVDGLYIYKLENFGIQLISV